MAHKEQFDFCRKVKAKFPQYFKNKIVVDVGSLDINGSNKYLFENCLYIGIDIGVGKNVDFVCKGHELKLPDESVDVIISTECFEHDMYYDKTLKNIYRMLKPGGFFIFSCATTGRPEHGTRRTTPKDAPLLLDENNWSDYYKNLTAVDVDKVLNVQKNFSEFNFSANNDSHDLYFYGIKVGAGNEVQDCGVNLSHNHATLYIGNVNGDFCEEMTIKSNLFSDLFDFSKFNINADTQLRFDPSNCKCMVYNMSFIVLDDDGNEHICEITRQNAIFVKGAKYYFDTSDPQLYLSSSTFCFTKFKYSYQIEYLDDVAYFDAYKLLECNIEREI